MCASERERESGRGRESIAPTFYSAHILNAIPTNSARTQLHYSMPTDEMRNTIYIFRCPPEWSGVGGVGRMVIGAGSRDLAVMLVVVRPECSTRDTATSMQILIEGSTSSAPGGAGWLHSSTLVVPDRDANSGSSSARVRVRLCCAELNLGARVAEIWSESLSCWVRGAGGFCWSCAFIRMPKQWCCSLFGVRSNTCPTCTHLIKTCYFNVYNA